MNERLAQFLKLEGLTAVKFAEIMEVQPSSISHLLSGRNKPNFEFISRILLRFPALNPDWIINGVGVIYKSNTQASDTNINDVNRREITNVTVNIGQDTTPLLSHKITEESLFDDLDNEHIKDIQEEIRKVTSVTTLKGEWENNHREWSDNLSAAKIEGVELESSLQPELYKQTTGLPQIPPPGLEKTEKRDIHSAETVQKPILQAQESEPPRKISVNIDSIPSISEVRPITRIIFFYTDGSFEEYRN